MSPNPPRAVDEVVDPVLRRILFQASGRDQCQCVRDDSSKPYGELCHLGEEGRDARTVVDAAHQRAEARGGWGGLVLRAGQGAAAVEEVRVDRSDDFYLSSIIKYM